MAGPYPRTISSLQPRSSSGSSSGAGGGELVICWLSVGRGGSTGWGAPRRGRRFGGVEGPGGGRAIFRRGRGGIGGGRGGCRPVGGVDRGRRSRWGAGRGRPCF